MPSYANIADDVLLAMGYSHDDALRHREAVMYNATLIVSKLQKQRLTKQYATGDARAASSSVSTFIVPVSEIDVPGSVFTEWDSKFFDLPTQVYSLDHDGGINFIRYLRNNLPKDCSPAVANTPFTGATLASMNTYYGSAYQRPTTARPYYARARENTATGIKDRVYLFGVGQGITHLLVGLYAIPSFNTIDPDAPVDLPDELLLTLKKMLMDMEAWALQIPQERIRNDGRDLEPNQVVSTRPAVSVNDPSQIDP